MGLLVRHLLSRPGMPGCLEESRPARPVSLRGALEAWACASALFTLSVESIVSVAIGVTSMMLYMERNACLRAVRKTDQNGFALCDRWAAIEVTGAASNELTINIYSSLEPTNESA